LTGGYGIDMRLVIDARTATDHFPGIGRYVISLSHALSQIAPDLCISLLYDSSATTSCLALPALPRIECSVSPFSIRQQWIVPGKLRRAQATLYHSPYYLMPYVPGIPAVLTCYDLIPLIYPQYFSLSKRLVYWVAHTLAFKTARMILTISQTTKDDLIHYFHLDPKRIIVTPLAADPHFQPQSHDRIAAVRRRYALPEKYVLYVGSNKPHKNLQRLIEAWKIAECGMRNAECKLVIAGHWDERYPEAKKLSEESGLKNKVLFIGQVEDSNLPALYSGAQLFVFPSLYEGFGLPVIEAMACGVPVLCSSVSSLPEVTGDAALLVAPLDVNSLAAAMNRLLADEVLRREMSRKGLVQARKFSWERTARETVNVYTGVVNQ
jgi:alpha-1,3-rhamnosyl/mannosyltransferase